MEKIKKYYIYIILLAYLFKVYGSLVLYKFGLISKQVWIEIHYIGVCFLMCSFLYLLKDKVNPFAYSFGMAIFVSRLFTETFTRGREHWYEMVSVIALTIVFHFINKNKNWIIKKIKSYGA